MSKLYTIKEKSSGFIFNTATMLYFPVSQKGGGVFVYSGNRFTELKIWTENNTVLYLSLSKYTVFHFAGAVRI